jgi:hypothetical protein
MTGFSAEWLALRETADGRAAAPVVLAALRRWARARPMDGEPLRVIDLGAGTGSTLRRLAPILPGRQSWLLVDDDARLLAQADAVVSNRGAFQQVRVRAAVRDLAAPGVLRTLLRDIDLVTASALFDLASASWCASLMRTIARPGCAIYAALIFDGQIVLDPADPFDPVLCRLFNAHQRRDKGFGPALGPVAARALIRLAAAHGAAIRVARSGWQLGPSDRALLEPMLAHWAQAASEMQPVQRAAVEAWADRRLRQAEAGMLCARVGHVDLLATW